MTAMINPYKTIGAAWVNAAVAGARMEVKSNVGTLSERLQKFAFYMTEQQQDAGDALLVMDLHNAVMALRDAREMATGVLDLQVGCLAPEEMRDVSARIIRATS